MEYFLDLLTALGAMLVASENPALTKGEIQASMGIRLCNPCLPREEGKIKYSRPFLVSESVMLSPFLHCDSFPWSPVAQVLVFSHSAAGNLLMAACGMM